DRRDGNREPARLFRRGAQSPPRRTPRGRSAHSRRRKATQRFGRGRQDRGVHRLAGKNDPRRGESLGGTAWRQSVGLGIEENRLRRRRARGRVEARRNQKKRGY